MSLLVQRGFWQDTVIADTRRKLAELYYKNPEIAHSEKKCLLEYWSVYEGLSELLGTMWPQFVEWFLHTTSPETITRCLRALKEDGTITLTPDSQKRRQDRQNELRQYWGNQRRLIEGNDDG